MPATVSPAPKSNSPSSPASTQPSPSNSNSPPKFFSVNFPPRNPSASLAVKTSPPSANGPAPAPSPPTNSFAPFTPLSSARFIPCSVGTLACAPTSKKSSKLQNSSSAQKRTNTGCNSERTVFFVGSESAFSFSALNPYLIFPLTSSILLRKIFGGELHESQTLPASHRLFPAVRNATLRPNSTCRNSSSQSPLQLQRPRSCPGQTRAHGFRSQRLAQPRALSRSQRKPRLARQRRISRRLQ